MCASACLVMQTQKQMHNFYPSLATPDTEAIVAVFKSCWSLHRLCAADSLWPRSSRLRSIHGNAHSPAASGQQRRTMPLVAPTQPSQRA